MPRLVIVPAGTTWARLPLGSLQQIADADYVVSADGHILKDRYMELEVAVIDKTP